MSNLVENTSAENLKTSRDTPTDKPINYNIRERLNLHVKRRLQESAADTSSHNNNDTTTANNNDEVKTRKQYTKRTEKQTVSVGRRAKRAKLKHVPSSSGAVNNKDSESVGSVASTSTTASAGDDEGSHDGNSQGIDVPHSPREKDKCPDLLSLVLNMKKRALFRDPEVVKFLHQMLDILRE